MKIMVRFKDGKQKTLENVRSVQEFPDEKRVTTTRQQRKDQVRCWLKKNSHLTTNLDALARKAKDEGIYSISSGLGDIAWNLRTYINEMEG